MSCLNRETVYLVERLLKHSQENEDGTAVMVDKEVLKQILYAASQTLMYEEMYTKAQAQNNQLHTQVQQLTQPTPR